MTEVVVFPQSGYANRLQAMVSSALLAEAIGANWHVCWEWQEVAPAAPEAIFAPPLVTDHVITSQEAEERWGLRKTDLPLYLTEDAASRRIVLAGHDRGEQAFMPALREMLTVGLPDVIAIVAGGKFTLDGDVTLSESQARRFRQERCLAYQGFRFSEAIEEAASTALEGCEPFIGLHLRYSDRSLEAPWRRDIWPAMRRLRETEGMQSVFIASDGARERDRWTLRLAREGMEPWSVAPATSDRSDPASAFGALVDWRILTKSSAMAYFAASSFAEEAAVASGGFDRGIGLPPSVTRAMWVRGREYARAGVTYPARHGWLPSSRRKDSSSR